MRGGGVPSVRFERTLASPSDWCLCHWATRAGEPSPGADPGLLPYEGKVTAVCDGEAAGQRLELRFTAPEAAVLPLDDPAMSTGGGSRTRTSSCSPDFEAGAAPSYATPAGTGDRLTRG